MKITPKAGCVCGQPLPWHLFTLELGLRHTCSCGRAYKETDGTVTEQPATAEDAAMARAFNRGAE